MHRFIYYILIFVFLILAWSCSDQDFTTYNIGYIILDEDKSPEDRAVVSWLKSNKYFDTEVITIRDIKNQPDNFDVLWIHIPDSIAFQDWKEQSDILNQIELLYSNGARILFTNFASLLIYNSGIESKKPEIRTIDIKDNWLFDKKGLHSWKGHPVFTDLFGGSFIWDSFQDHRLSQIGFFDNNFPENGKVVGVEKSYITIHRTNRLMIEYQNEKGRALGIGAFILFDKENRLRYKMQKFTENCLLYLAGKFSGEKRTYWKQFDYTPKEFNVKTTKLSLSSERKLSHPSKTELEISFDHPEDHFFDLAGRRALIMGKENAGIDELWVHPFRILRDYRVGIVKNGTIIWLSDLPLRIEIRPESLTRIYQTPAGELKEIIFPSLDKAGAIVHYKANTKEEVALLIQFRSDLRWMWPYDEYALGAVYYAYDSNLNALHVKDGDGDFYCIYGGDIKPVKTLSGAYAEISWDEGELAGKKTELNQVYHSAVYLLSKENDHCINYCMVGTNQGRDESINHYHHLMNHTQEEYDNLVSHYQNLLDNFVTFESPDKEFNRLWKWALIGTDRFCTYTPPLGTALLAGFSTTERGWNGRHKISGRPGYAWYFGRDSEWSGFAVNDYGDFALVKKQLEFLQKFQDLSGKILHELSTSGVVHYDAADATPLYIILAAHYLRASGDIDFIHTSWPHIEKAMLFLYSTDTDDDRLIENTNVGHGWVEGGKLWGANTTFYLAALWAQTLKDAAYIAGHLGKSGLEKKYTHDSKRVKEILNTDFYCEKDQFYYYGKFTDGTYNSEKTVLPAVGMYFDLLDETRSKKVLQQYAGNGFSSDWGVRILSSESPLFNPRGYHYGSVWPLFTGWTALAEYEYGRSVQGYIHISNNMYLKNHWASGFVEEVMNGAEYTPSGVCPHQCWSETNILHPAITGMIGWKPFAPESKVILKPRFPLHWADVTVNNLAVGNARIKLQMTRQKNETKFRVFLTEGMPIKISFAPEIAAGTIIEKITINDEQVDIPSGLMRGLIDPPLEFDLNQVSDIVFKHTKGVGMIPQTTQPNPGEISEGYRIISTILDKNRYEIVFEGRSGTRGNFKIMIFDQEIKSINGASFDKIDENGINQITVTFPSSNQKYVKKRVIIEL